MTAIAADTSDHAKLTAPLPWLHPKAIYYATMRGLLGSVGRLSAGIRIGYAHGFDSGVMLDYVYANEAHGPGLAGRLIDRAFLNARGWRGIRGRGVLLTATIERCIAEAWASAGPVTLVDLACGGGRYALDAAAVAGDPDLALVLRDYRPANVEAAAAHAARRGIAARTEPGDAFSDRDLAALGRRADIVVVSGLHEIVPEDALVSRHPQQIADHVLRPGGVLILTVQPTHPQLEFIARVLPSHTGRPWAMRLRPLARTVGALKRAGYRVESIDFESEQIFGVVVARLQPVGTA